jgi:2-phosphosulfolactate phosphatase
MEIEILQLIEGAKNAIGLTVVIDVFRAFSLACYIMEQGAKEIISVGDIKLAYKLKEENPGYILVGERHEKIPKGFDYGNSPTQIQGIDFSDKTIVHTTSAGTQGIVNAIGSSEIITGSFVNVPAIIKYIKSKNPEIVSLVCMGYEAKYPTEEDTFCAEYIQDSLLGKPTDFEAMIEIIRDTSGRRLFEPQNQLHSPESDFYLCTELGRFNFILKADNGKDGLTRLNKIECQ